MAWRSLARRFYLSSRLLSTATHQPAVTPAVGVEDERVQSLLTQLTGMDFDKVFSARKEPLEPPTYKLMSWDELEKAHTESVERARQLLRMPPVLSEREPKGAVIEKDEKLDKAIKQRYVFTDTTQHMDDKDRQIVVREVDGTLREADWGERDRMCQLFFPKLGRKMWLPKMFHPQQLPKVLSLGHHLTVLDCVCVQCAPDSKEYIRVHRTVYEDVEQRGLYEMLWSTRYFGCLVWHLLTSGTINGLLKHTLDKKRLGDAGGLLRLHLLCYPGSEFAISLDKRSSFDKTSDIALVEAFCEHYGLSEMSENLLKIKDRSERRENTDSKEKTEHSALS